MEYKIIALKIATRDEAALEAQRVMTEYGCSIKVRLGLHDSPPGTCSPEGLVLMEVVGDDAELEAFVNKLNAIRGCSAKYLQL